MTDHAELIEKVARAIYEAGPPIRDYRWHDLTQLTQGTFYKQAAAAIAALGDGWPSISTELINKLNKLATYLTEQGEYEACDLIDTVVERLTPPPGAKP